MSVKKCAFFVLLLMAALTVGAVAFDSGQCRPNNQTQTYDCSVGNGSQINNIVGLANAATPDIVIEFYTQFRKEACNNYGCTGRNVPWVKAINKDNEKKIIMIRGEQYTLDPNSSVSVPLDWTLAD